MKAEGDVRLVDRLRRGDPVALDTLFRMHAQPVHRAASSFLADASHAEDVVQDVFFTLWKRRTSVHLAGETVLPWLLVTARNISYSTNRRELRRRHQPLTDDLHVPGPDNGMTDRLLDVRRLVDLMSPKDRSIWEACIEQDMSYAEAARSLNLTHGTVRNRLSRLRASVSGAGEERAERHAE